MKARKIIICVLATLSLSSVALAESGVYRYVNTLDGVNVRDKPSLSGKKKFALKCNERVELLEETAEKEKIGDSEKPWCKIRTQSGSWGFVYGEYLSRTLEDAADFRCYEILNPVEDWLEEQAEQFTSTMNIDRSRRNISSFSEEDTTRVYGQGINFIFYPTKDEESGKEGSFLLGVYVYDNDCLPKDFPLQIGDSMEKVRDIFGKKPNGEAYFFENIADLQAWEGGYVRMHVFDDGENIVGIKFDFAPGW